MEFKELMSALAENAGMDGGFPPDEDGVVRVGWDDLLISFMEVPEERMLLMWSPVGLLPETGADAIKTGLLRANFMGRAVNGGTLSLSDEGGVFLHKMLPLMLQDKAIFLKAVEDFVATLADWTNALAEYEPEAARPDADATDAGDQSQFMRV